MSAANRYATALDAQGLTAQVARAEIAGWLAGVRRMGARGISKVRLSSLIPKHFADYREDRLKLVKGTALHSRQVLGAASHRHLDFYGSLSAIAAIQIVIQNMQTQTALACAESITIQYIRISVY